MRKIIVYIAMSVDGFIAEKNGSVNWLEGDGSDLTDQGSYLDFINSIDTVILGYNTYNQIITELAVDSWPYEEQKSYIVTHKELEDKENIFFVKDCLKTLIAKLKEETGKDIWICGGANIVNQLLELDLVDELTLSVIPTILGDGIKLFGKINKKLKLKSTINYNGIVESTYTFRK